MNLLAFGGGVVFAVVSIAAVVAHIQHRQRKFESPKHTDPVLDMFKSDLESGRVDSDVDLREVLGCTVVSYVIRDHDKVTVRNLVFTGRASRTRGHALQMGWRIHRAIFNKSSAVTSEEDE